MMMRAWLHEELREWRASLVAEGFPAGDDDFIIPGAAPDGRYTLEQQHNFIRDIKACGRVAAARDPDRRAPRAAGHFSFDGEVEAARRGLRHLRVA